MGSNASDAILEQTYPQPRTFLPDAQERELQRLYSHPPGTVRIGMLVSHDGKVAGPDGSSRSLNSPADVRVLRTLRAQADVVIVGASTAQSERYGDISLSESLIASREHRGATPEPDLAIVTRTGTLPPGLDRTRTWVLTTQEFLPSLSLPALWDERVLLAGHDTFSPAAAITALTAKGLTRILVEGGPTVAHAFIAAGEVSDICLTTSPLPGGPAAPLGIHVPDTFMAAHTLSAGGFTMTRWVTAPTG